MVRRKKRVKSKNDEIEMLSRRVTELENALKKKATKSYKKLSVTLNEDLKEIEGYARKNPMKAVAVAFVVGLILGGLGKRG